MLSIEEDPKLLDHGRERLGDFQRLVAHRRELWGIPKAGCS